MFKIPYVAPIQVISPTGKPMVTEIEVPNEPNRRVPVLTEQFDFLMDRTTDAMFADGMRGMDAQEFVSDARKALSRQREIATERKYWLLEDVVARRMLKATENGSYGALAYNHVTFMRANKAMEPFEEEPETSKEEGNTK